MRWLSPFMENLSISKNVVKSLTRLAKTFVERTVVRDNVLKASGGIQSRKRTKLLFGRAPRVRSHCAWSGFAYVVGTKCLLTKINLKSPSCALWSLNLHNGFCEWGLSMCVWMWVYVHIHENISLTITKSHHLYTKRTCSSPVKHWRSFICSTGLFHETLCTRFAWFIVIKVLLLQLFQRNKTMA